jgi:flagellar biogenesis protein FliO
VAHKAQVVLVAVGERRLVVGVTASSMTTLADVDPSDLEPAGTTTIAESTGDPLRADSALPQGFQAALRRAAAAAGLPGAATFTGGGR